MIGRTNAGGGGGGKKSLILPTNPDLSIKSDDSKLVLSWTQPETEVEVDHYNIYTSLSEPSSLKDMELVGSVKNTNKWNNVLLDYSIFNNTGTNTYTNGSTTYTINDDKSISITSGTSTNGDVEIAIVKTQGTYKLATLSDGHYRFSGCPSGGGSSKYFIRIEVKNGSYIYDYGDGVEFDASNSNIEQVVIGVKSGQYVDGLVFKPKLEKLTEYTFDLTNLTNDQTYYVGIQAVSVEGYENASMWKVENGVPSAIIWVAVGNGGSSAYSTDGITWNARSVGGNDINCVAYGNGIFVLPMLDNTNYSYFLNSTNGNSWDHPTSGSYSFNAIIKGMTYGNDRFVAVGHDGKSYYSLDGLKWVAMSGLNSSRQYFSVAYGNGRFIAVGNGGSSAYSLDGATWVNFTGLETGTGFNGICYGNGRFVTVGNSGYSYCSTSGSSWARMSNFSSLSGDSVTYGNGRFVSVGCFSGKSYYSTNGTSWHVSSTQLEKIAELKGITFAKDRFICVGCSGSSAYSLDGDNWIAMSGLDTSTTYYAVTSNVTE